MKQDILTHIDIATKSLIAAWEQTHESELADILDMISAYRDEHVENNSQFGMGA